MRHLHSFYGDPASLAVPRVRVRRVNSNGELQNTHGDSYAAASGLELSE